MPNPNLERLILKNLLYSIQTLIGSELFKHLYVRNKQSGEEFDALNNGEGSCAFVVSGVLALHGLIDHPHATVTTTIQHMQQAGWTPTTKPKPGDVVQWPAHNNNTHIAFYLSNDKAIGNSTTQRKVAQYSLTLPDGRKPIAYYTHPSL